MKKAIVYLNEEIFESLFRNGNYELKIDGLPRDARFLGASFDCLRGSWLCYFESVCFKKTKEGELLPILNVEISIIEVDEDEKAEKMSKETEMKLIAEKLRSMEK